ncbi:MAG TPA: T9SS type A sorting domain-containing protein [bacterium]|nr:T9SS type A sorting domain-containing protein [bacterium]HPN42827.1 T9SS type A sorting domain-containing protein [bacterium]
MKNTLFKSAILLLHTLFVSFSVANEGSVHITWDPVTVDINGNAEEIIYYYIYCDDSPYIEPLKELLVGATADNNFYYTDDRLLNPEIQLHFLVTAVDVFGNESGFVPDNTLPVKLTDYNLEEENGAVVISWTTQSEKDILGYNIFKATDKNSDWKKMNPTLIKSAGGATVKTEYSYRDSTAVPLQTLYYKLESVEIDGQSTMHEMKSIYVTTGKPDKYTITQNYPNPFNPQTTIDYAVPEGCRVQVIIYNTRGEKVQQLADHFHPAGIYSIKWDGRNYYGAKVSSGVYFYKIITQDFTEIKKMILAK